MDEKMLNDDVTIIHSYIKEYELPLLEKNIELNNIFNPDSQHQTLVVDNSSDNLTIAEDRVQIVTGVTNLAVEVMAHKRQSDGLAAALRLGIRASDTRYICVIDPDFFVCLPYWIEEMKQYMEATGTRIIAASHSPEHYIKRHTFASHFVFVDTRYIPKILLNFMPDKIKFNTLSPRFALSRFDIGKRSDCGDLIERRFSDQIEYLVPLYERKHNLKLNLLDKILPTKWRYERDTPFIAVEDKPFGLDYYTWQQYLFGVHCRLYLRPTDKIPMDLIAKTIGTIYAGYKKLGK